MTLFELSQKLGVSEGVAFDLIQIRSIKTIEVVPGLSTAAIDTIIRTPGVVIEQIKQFPDNLVDAVKTPIEMTKADLEGIKDSVQSSLKGIFDVDVKEKLQTAAKSEQQAIMSALDREIDSIVGKMFKEEIGFDDIQGLVSNMTTQVLESVTNLITGVVGTITGIIDSIVGTVQTAISNVMGFLNNITTHLFSTIMGAIYGAIFGPLNIIANLMKQYWDAAIQIFTAAFHAGKFFFDLVTDIPKELGLGFSDIKHGVLPGSLTPRPLSKHPLLPSESDVHRVSRGDDTVYQPGGMKYVYDSQRDPLIEDPPMRYSATYPYNHYFETESGHVFEYDDTPSFERIQYKHRTGTGIHINPEGAQRFTCVSNNYTVILGDDAVHVHGSTRVFVDGSSEISVNGDANLNIGMNCNMSVGKNLTIDVGETFTLRAKRANIGTLKFAVTAGFPRVKPLHETHIPRLESFDQRIEGSDSSSVSSSRGGSRVSPDIIKQGIEAGELSRAEVSERTPETVVPTETDTGPSSKPSSPAILSGGVKAPKNPNDWRDPAYDQKISDYFYLRDVCHANLYVHALRAQCGLSLQRIVDNLTTLARVGLDPVISMFGNAGFSTYGRKPGPVIMTCAFRRQSCGSWHPKGCAADFQFKGIANSEYYNRAIKMRDNISGFDHILLEYKTTGSKLPWIHIGVVPGQARGNCATWMNHARHSSGFKNLAVRAKK